MAVGHRYEMRLLKSLGTISLLLIAGLALASQASAATTLSATANANQTGTPQSPQPVVAALNTTIDNNGASPTPIPVAQTASITQTFPAEFASQLASYGSCAQSQFDAPETPPGGAEDPTVSCPANSIVGNGSMKTVTQAGPNTLVATSEKVVIVKNATTGGLSFWVTFEIIGSRVSQIVPGTVATNGAGQTVITWDPTPIQPAEPFVVKLAEFNTAYNNNAGTVQPLEPFFSTGCASGIWTFSILNAFVGGSPASQTATANVACTALAPLTPPTAALAGTATILSRTLKVSPKGKGTFTVKCSTAGPCAGSFEIRPKGKKSSSKRPKKAPLARGKYSLDAGETAKVKFTLTRRGKAMLEQRDGSLLATLRLKPTTGKSTARTVRLKQASSQKG